MQGKSEKQEMITHPTLLALIRWTLLILACVDIFARRRKTSFREKCSNALRPSTSFLCNCSKQSINVKKESYSNLNFENGGITSNDSQNIVATIPGEVVSPSLANTSFFTCITRWVPISIFKRKQICPLCPTPNRPINKSDSGQIVRDANPIKKY